MSHDYKKWMVIPYRIRQNSTMDYNCQLTLKKHTMHMKNSKKKKIFLVFTVNKWIIDQIKKKKKKNNRLIRLSPRHNNSLYDFLLDKVINLSHGCCFHNCTFSHNRHTYPLSSFIISFWGFTLSVYYIYEGVFVW